MIGSLSIFTSYLLRSKQDRKELGIRMVFIESILDFIASLFFAIGPAFIPDKGWDDNEDPTTGCIVQVAVALRVKEQSFLFLTLKHEKQLYYSWAAFYMCAHHIIPTIFDFLTSQPCMLPFAVVNRALPSSSM